LVLPGVFIEIRIETGNDKRQAQSGTATESAESDSTQSKLLKPILILIVGIRTNFIYDWNVEAIDTEESPLFNYCKQINRVKIQFKEVASKVGVWGPWIYLAVKMLVRENVLKRKNILFHVLITLSLESRYLLKWGNDFESKLSFL
jgi:hypothetical protein